MSCRVAVAVTAKLGGRVGGHSLNIRKTTRVVGRKTSCPPRNPEAVLGGRHHPPLTALACPRTTRLRTSSWREGGPGITSTSHPSDLATHQSRGPGDVAGAPSFCGIDRGHCHSCNIHEPYSSLGGHAPAPPPAKAFRGGLLPTSFFCFFGPGFAARHVSFWPFFLL